MSSGERNCTGGRGNCGVGERPVAAGHRNFNAGAQPVAGGERPVDAGAQPVAAKGGNVMNAVFDATALRLWVSYAGAGQEAYQRPYVHLDLATLDADQDGKPDFAVTRELKK